TEDPRPCPLLRDGPDSGRVAAARSAPCRPGAQFGGPRSGTFLDLRSHQSLRPDFGEGRPLSSGHYLHRADTHEQPSRRDFPIERLEGALVTTPAGASDRPHSPARLDVLRSCWVPTDDNPETRASSRSHVGPVITSGIFHCFHPQFCGQAFGSNLLAGAAG